MTEVEKAEKDFLQGNISFNELRERKGLKPIPEGDILITREKRKVFYLCNGEVPYCGKHTCYKGENPPDEPCMHTTNVAYALNFVKIDGHISYRENPKEEKYCSKKECL